MSIETKITSLELENIKRIKAVQYHANVVGAYDRRRKE